MSDDLAEEVKVVYRRTSNLMELMGFTIVILFALNYYLSGLHPASTSSTSGVTQVVFTVIVLVIGIGAIMLRRFMFRAAKLETIQVRSGIKGLLAYLSQISVTLAFVADFAAICGFISGMLTGDTAHSSSLILVGVVILAVSFPRRAAWLRS